jgi:hypothetical protein
VRVIVVTSNVKKVDVATFAEEERETTVFARENDNADFFVCVGWSVARATFVTVSKLIMPSSY